MKSTPKKNAIGLSNRRRGRSCQLKSKKRLSCLGGGISPHERCKGVIPFDSRASAAASPPRAGLRSVPLTSALRYSPAASAAARASLRGKRLQKQTFEGPSASCPHVRLCSAFQCWPGAFAPIFPAYPPAECTYPPPKERLRFYRCLREHSRVVRL